MAQGQKTPRRYHHTLGLKLFESGICENGRAPLLVITPGVHLTSEIYRKYVLAKENPTRPIEGIIKAMVSVARAWC